MISYDKLVRDRVIEHIANNGGIASYCIVKGKDKFIKAVEKLNEEKLELIAALNLNDKNKIIEEIADIKEVQELLDIEFLDYITADTQKQIDEAMVLVDKAVTEFELDDSEIQTIKKNKLEKKGGFKKGILLERAS